MDRASCTVYYPDQQMHNTYFNSILYILSTAMYCNYNSWHSSQRFMYCILSSTIPIT